MSKIIDTSEPKTRSRSHRKGPIAIVAVVLVLAVVAGLVFLSNRQSSQDATKQGPQQDSVSAANDEASRIASTKSTGEAMKFYDEKISDSRGDEKVQLLLGKAAVAFNASDFDTALKVAVEANGIKESSATLHMIAQTYEAKGDRANALDYYKRALAVLPKDEASKRLKVEFESKINELSGQ